MDAHKQTTPVEFNVFPIGNTNVFCNSCHTKISSRLDKNNSLKNKQELMACVSRTTKPFQFFSQVLWHGASQTVGQVVDPHTFQCVFYFYFI